MALLVVTVHIIFSCGQWMLIWGSRRPPLSFCGGVRDSEIFPPYPLCPRAIFLACQKDLVKKKVATLSIGHTVTIKFSRRPNCQKNVCWNYLQSQGDPWMKKYTFLNCLRSFSEKSKKTRFVMLILKICIARGLYTKYELCMHGACTSILDMQTPTYIRFWNHLDRSSHFKQF